MFARDFHPARFLRGVYATGPFRDYCALRGIAFAQDLSEPDAASLRRWAEALSSLSREEQARVELDLAWVNEMAGRDGLAHLRDAIGEAPPADVPDGVPLALWFFVRHQDVFHEVFVHHEVREAGTWRAVRMAPSRLPTDPAAAAALGEELCAFFRLDAGAGRFCAVDARPFHGTLFFAAHVADRIRLLEGFTEQGQLGIERVRPALSVLFAFCPAENVVLLKSHLRAADRIRELLACFGRAVLGVSMPGAEERYDLDRLKFPFAPLPDAPDLDRVRVKSLHLRYPARLGQRRLALETRVGDGPSAIMDLLTAHVGGKVLLEELRVSHAELEVRLLVRERWKYYPVRLWSDRSNLGPTPLGWRLRGCLRRWGLAHGF